MKIILYSFALLFFICSCSSRKEKKETSNYTWEQITQIAQGKTVNLMMWKGDLLINKYMADYVAVEVQKRFGVTLHILEGHGNSIVSTLMTELEAKKPESEVDMIWINGETFYQLRQINALYGPFVEKLPNNQYINWESPFIAYDFQQAVEGYECPWGNVQLALIYNSDKVQNPPMNLNELEIWVKEHPGKFTIGNEFAGLTLLKSWLIHLAGGQDSLSGEFSEEKYLKHSAQLWTYLNRIKPYFWNNGKSFPASIAQMHQMFANGELWFTISNNDAEVDNKILQGIFPENSRAYVPESGTIQNSHYMGIVRHSANKEAAMVVCNFLISPEAQLKKMQPSVWGDYTILSASKLNADWQQKFKVIPDRKYAPKRADFQGKALREPAPEYMIRLFDDFRKEVIEK